ncbi:Uncharacterised protein [Bordetella pertussis]|nr:Uncharacterised protein [Bordetella pertussis]
MPRSMRRPAAKPRRSTAEVPPSSLTDRLFAAR